MALYQLIEYYEATNDSFFIDKVRNTLKHIKTNTATEIALRNDLDDGVLLDFVFAISNEPLTEDEGDFSLLFYSQDMMILTSHWP